VLGTNNRACEGVYGKVWHVSAQINPTAYANLGWIYPAVRAAVRGKISLFFFVFDLIVRRGSSFTQKSCYSKG
jgi:hypothetical protein